MMLTARALLNENPDPTDDEIREAISGQICRCTGYATIVRSIRWAAEHPARPEEVTRLMATVEEDAADRLRPPQAQGGRALHPRPGQLRRRRPAHRHAARRRPAQPRRARADRLHRHHRRPAAPQGPAPSSPGKDLEGLGLAWMPTLSADTQAVLATDKVRFQGQEVAFVIADDRYSARDALELIDVEYDVLPAVVNARKALDPDAPVIRDDKEGKTDNHIFDWESGDREATDAVFANADVVVAEDMLYPRSHPAPMETCGAVADYDKVDGSLTLWCTTQAPHAHRTVYALVAGLPEHKIRVISPDIGGGFGGKVGIYPGLRVRRRRLDRHRPAGEVDGGPLREPHGDRVRARLRHARRDRRDERREDPRRPRRRHRRPRRVQLDRAADEVPRRLLPRVHRVLRPAGRALQREGRLHEQGARRRRVRVLVPDHRGRLPRRAHGRRARPRARRRPGGAAPEEPHPARPVPVREQDRLGVRLRRVRDGLRKAMDMAGYEELRREQAEKRARGRAHGHRRRLLHRGRRRRAAQAHGHPRPRHGRRRRAARAPDRQGDARPQRADAGPGPRDDVRPDRRRGARHPARGHRRRPRRHRPHAVRPRHVRLALHAGERRGDRDRRAQGARQGADHRVGDARGRRRGPRVGEGPLVREGRPGQGRDDPGDRDGRPRRGRAARGRRGRAGLRDGLQPAEPHVPVRRVHLRRRRGPGHRAR